MVVGSIFWEIFHNFHITFMALLLKCVFVHDPSICLCKHIYIYIIDCFRRQEMLVLAKSSCISNRVRFNIHYWTSLVRGGDTPSCHIPKELPCKGGPLWESCNEVSAWWSIHFTGLLDSWMIESYIPHGHLTSYYVSSIHTWIWYILHHIPISLYGTHLWIDQKLSWIELPPKNISHLGKRNLTFSKVPAGRGYVIVPRRVSIWMVWICMDTLQVSTSLFFSTSLGCKAISSWLNGEESDLNLRIGGWIRQRKKQ